jgi:protein SCO1/2
MTTAGEFMRNIIYFTIVVIVLAVAAAFVINQAESSRQAIPVLGEVPDFTFTERSGVPFGLDNMKGRINVVDFIFTNCPGPCPMMSAVMSDLYHYYGKSDRIRFISISVDPLRDTLETLREYAKRFDVDDNGWVFVLVDSKGRIRGYYHPEDNASMELLKRHIRQLAQEM